ncbi:MAG: DUF983 domain-containing protein [Robiginitomaculum sp.]|nr:DUF983 domain-containing protein [Robiginitomaculum sp.]
MLGEPKSPVLRGLLGTCPACGNGALFAGYLQFADHCTSCQLDFSANDAGDGPAVLVMTLVGFLVVFPALLVELAFGPPVWVHALLWLPFSTILVLAFLRPFRGLWFGLMLKYQAGEAKLDNSDQL